MLHYGRFLLLTTLVALMPCSAVRAQRQEQENDRRPEPRNAVTSRRTVEPSDLAKDNMARVAASSAQIQSVLARDAGILVELKAWVAKEATDNGQVVDDSLLTDLAIFDRLDHDVGFRSVATRLVQRYGYLLPGVNPDSEIGKQQELVLKARAHIMAQRQDQEQEAALAAAETERRKEQQQARVERTSCDPRGQSKCNQPASPGKGIGGSFQDDIAIPDMTLPILPDQMSPADSQRTMRRSSADQSDSGGSSGMDSGLTLASDTRRSTASGSSGAGTGSGMNMGMGGGMPAAGTDGVDGMLRRGNMDRVCP